MTTDATINKKRERLHSRQASAPQGIQSHFERLIKPLLGHIR
jgi:hypothetical protein